MPTLTAAARLSHTLPKRLLRKLFRRAPECILSPEQCEHFREQGYLVLDPQIPADLLNRVQSDLVSTWHKTPAGTPGYEFTGRVFDAWRMSLAVKRIATWPRILRALTELYARTPLPFQTLNFPVGTEQEVHSDIIHFNSAPSTYMCGVWIAFEDMDLDNGPLIYYPGSHKMPEYSLANCHKPAKPESYEHYSHYLELLQRVIAKHQLQPAYATVKRGQAFIWASNLFHGGSPRRDRNRSRHSQVTHYFFEGCRYFTPLFTEAEEVYWRHPEWVTWTEADQVQFYGPSK